MQAVYAATQNERTALPPSNDVGHEEENLNALVSGRVGAGAESGRTQPQANLQPNVVLDGANWGDKVLNEPKITAEE